MAFVSRAVCVVMLAMLASTALAQKECKITRQPQTANLANASPKGCLKELVNATAGDALQDLITPDCFNKLTLNLTNVTGGADCPLRSFTVSFADKKKCAEGFDVIANGNLTATAKAGVYNAAGQFETGSPFKGTLNDKGQMTVTVQGSKCELTYALKAAGKAVPVEADEATADAKEPAAAGAKAPAAAAGSTAAPKGAEAPKPAEAPKKSSAAGTSASALLALLCAVLAFVL